MGKALTIKLNGQTITVERQPWDTQMLERECARIADIQGKGSLAGLSDRLKQERLDYVIARLQKIESDQIQSLTQEGFVQLEGIECFCHDQLSGKLSEKLPAKPSNNLPDKKAKSEFLEIRQATPKDASEIANLCARTFKQSRFHTDPLITNEQATKIHYEWGKNSVLGIAADVVWVSIADQQIVGMISCSLKNADAWIGLVCVDENHSGKGLAGRLVQQACHWAASKGANKIFVQTQADNKAAASLYVKQGFKPYQSFVTLRWSAKN